MAKAEAPAEPTTPGGRLLQAVSSPFAATDIALRLTSLFGYEPAKGSNLRALVHLDAGPLTFTTDQEGVRHAVLEIVAMTFAVNGQVVDRMARENSVRVEAAMLPEVRRHAPHTRPGARTIHAASGGARSRSQRPGRGGHAMDGLRGHRVAPTP